MSLETFPAVPAKYDHLSRISFISKIPFSELFFPEIPFPKVVLVSFFGPNTIFKRTSETTFRNEKYQNQKFHLVPSGAALLWMTFMA